MEHDFIRTINRDATVNVTQFMIGAENPYYQWFDDFHWIDQTLWDFDFRDPLRTANYTQCLVMETGGVGLWYEVNSTSPQFYICQRRAGNFDLAKAQSAVKTMMDLDTRYVDEELSNLAAEPPSMSDYDPSLSDDYDALPRSVTNCKPSTLILAPGILSAPDIPLNASNHNCSFTISTLGAYRVGLYFSKIDFSSGTFSVLDELGRELRTSQYQRRIIAPNSKATVTFNWNGYQNSSTAFEITYYAV